MLYAKKGNRQVKITKDSQAEYEKKGFAIIEVSDKGKKKVISKPANVKDLQAENKKLQSEISNLKKQIKELQAK